MNKSKKFSPEIRESAVRMVQEHRREYPSLWAAIESIAPKIGCVPLGHYTFAHRFNRRFDLPTLPQHLLIAVAQCRASIRKVQLTSRMAVISLPQAQATGAQLGAPDRETMAPPCARRCGLPNVRVSRGRTA